MPEFGPTKIAFQFAICCGSCNLRLMMSPANGSAATVFLSSDGRGRKVERYDKCKLRNWHWELEADGRRLRR